MNTTPAKTTVIYHSADYDGIFCREIAKKFLPPDTAFIGWNFGDPHFALPCKIQGGPKGTIYILDLPVDQVFGENFSNQFPQDFKQVFGHVVWIDHHKTSIDTHPPGIPGYRIDGVAACRLAWQWFTLCERIQPPPFTKEEFVCRKVLEPLAVRLVGEYDIWDKRDPDAETFQYALRCSNDYDESLQSLLTPNAVVLIEEMLKQGLVAQDYVQRNDASICKSLTWLMEWEGLKFLCVNHARFNALLFAAKDVPETGHDALLGFKFDGRQWTVSLYHAKHRTDLDLSEIAKKHGGGGHRGACGFTCKTLPFSL